jgi:Yip1 domain
VRYTTAHHQKQDCLYGSIGKHSGSGATGRNALSETIGPGPQGNALIQRVKAILLTPKDEWPKIAASPERIGDIYRRWVIPLAAIGPIATLIGGLAFGYGAFGFFVRPTLMGAISTAILSYVLALVSVYVIALIIDALAPSFGGTKNPVAAFKVAAFGATASWVAGVFGIVPALGFLGLLGLYSIYLIFLGLPLLMKSPPEKATGYIIAVVVVSFVVSLVAGGLTATLSRTMFGGGALLGGAAKTVTVPGGGTVDLGKLEEAGKKLEDATAKMQNGQGKPAIAPDVLQAVLPAAIGGLARTSIESASMGAAGVGGSTAEARYGAGDNVITLTVTDMGVMGGLAALGGALNVQSSKQDGTSYEKIGKVDGRMTTEKFDSADKRGEYGTIFGDRIMVQAAGTATSIDVLKGAVAAVDLGKVEALAKQ